MTTDPPPGARGGFPATRQSLLQAVASADPETRRRAFGTLVALYWKPVYKLLRLRHGLSPEDAEDLTQGFFTRAFEKGVLDRFDPARARFRTYLRTCLEGFAANERKAAGRIKRGGGQAVLSLDFGGAEEEVRGLEVASGLDPEELFHQEWVRAVFEQSVARLREELAGTGRGVHFELFQAYDIEGSDSPDRPTYADLARRFDLPVTQVTNFLAVARRELRRQVLLVLHESTGSDREAEEEARLLLGGP
jgi:RNA polymerase sigma factor (sigma-70 family)